MAPSRGTIPVERLQPILERVIATRDDPDTGVGGVNSVCEEIAMSTGRKYEAIAKRVWTIRQGWDSYHNRLPKCEAATATQKELLEEVGISAEGMSASEAFTLIKEHVKRRPVTHVTFETADAILTGLNLEYLWHTELEDLYLSA